MQSDNTTINRRHLVHAEPGQGSLVTHDYPWFKCGLV
uniref:Uncharacterized protein n=1 Tax=Anguilla anguilla TaxID=7936 RepID=A0A0E9WJ29_ANGAN